MCDLFSLWTGKLAEWRSLTYYVKNRRFETWSWDILGKIKVLHATGDHENLKITVHFKRGRETIFYILIREEMQS
jgi:hypothetical protein